MSQPPADRRRRQRRRQHKQGGVNQTVRRALRGIKLSSRQQLIVRTLVTVTVTLAGIWLVYTLAPRFLDAE